MGVNKSLSKRLAWWQADGYPIKRLYDGLSILNNLPKESFHNEFGRLYTALEAFANGRAIATRTDTAGPTRRFCSFVEHIVSHYSQGGLLLAENASRRLLEMDPLIANVGDNNDDPFEAHREFQIAVKKYRNRRDEFSLASAGKALGVLLCVIRGNTVHPDKSSGYLRSERTRNRIVLKAGIAVIQSLLERALNTPSSRLAVYGSLYRNGDNQASGFEAAENLSAPNLKETFGSFELNGEFLFDRFPHGVIKGEPLRHFGIERGWLRMIAHLIAAFPRQPLARMGDTDQFRSLFVPHRVVMPTDDQDKMLRKIPVFADTPTDGGMIHTQYHGFGVP